MNMLKTMAILVAFLGSGVLLPAISHADHVLTLSPSTALNTSDSIHTVTANLTQGGSAVAGVTVYFEVTGANADTGSAVTDSGGNASFSYGAGVGGAGVDTISACADADDGGLDGSFVVCAADPDDHDLTASVNKTWVDQFAKISGNTGPAVRGQAKQFSFQGLVGQHDDIVVGSLAVNYRSLRTVCTFTPGAGTFSMDVNEQIATLTGWTYSCTDGVGSGAADIVLTDNTAAGPRGSISVDASQDAYDIAASNLTTGNAHVDDLSTP